MTAPSLREAATMALEALEWNKCYLPNGHPSTLSNGSIQSLRSALALPDAEPVALGWAAVYKDGRMATDKLFASKSDAQQCVDYMGCSFGDLNPPRLAQVFSTPQPAPVERKPLTPLQANALPVWNGFIGLCFEQRERIVRGVEAAHGIKGAA